MTRQSVAKEMTALEIESAILKAVDGKDLDDIGDVVGVTGSAISKWKSEQKIRRFSRLLYAVGLKVVPQTDAYADVEHLETIFDLAVKGLQVTKSEILGSDKHK